MILISYAFEMLPHPPLLTKFGPMANMQTNEESSLDIFEMFVGTNEPKKEEVNKELQIFTRFQMDVKGHKIFFRVLGKTRLSISNYGISCLSHFGHYWFSNGN
jgi:hypothetical protein